MIEVTRNPEQEDEGKGVVKKGTETLSDMTKKEGFGDPDGSRGPWHPEKVMVDRAHERLMEASLKSKGSLLWHFVLIGLLSTSDTMCSGKKPNTFGKEILL